MRGEKELKRAETMLEATSAPTEINYSKRRRRRPQKRYIIVDTAGKVRAFLHNPEAADSPPNEKRPLTNPATAIGPGQQPPATGRRTAEERASPAPTRARRRKNAALRCLIYDIS